LPANFFPTRLTFSGWNSSIRLFVPEHQLARAILLIHSCLPAYVRYDKKCLIAHLEHDTNNTNLNETTLAAPLLGIYEDENRARLSFASSD